MRDLLRAFPAEDAPNSPQAPGQFRLGEVGLNLVQEAVDAIADGRVVGFRRQELERSTFDSRGGRCARDPIGPARRSFRVHFPLLERAARLLSTSKASRSRWLEARRPLPGESVGKRVALI
jgi:hypothetical protein